MMTKELYKRFQSLQGSLDSLKAQVEAISERNKASKQNEHTDADTSVLPVVSPPPSIPAYYDAENNESPSKRKRELIRLIVDIGGLLAVIAYVVVTARTLSEIKKQADSAKTQIAIMQKQFQMDQRPYVEVAGFQMIDTGAKRPSVPKIGSVLSINIVYRNVGKSLARNLNIHRHVIWGGPDKIRSEPPDANMGASFIAQNGSLFTTAVSLKNTFANETADIQPAELAYWDGTEPIILFGRITYSDAFNNLYCTPFQLRYLRSGSWQNVPTITDQKTGFRRTLMDLCPEGTGKPF